MYQFTEMFGEIRAVPVRKTQRWKGLFLGLALGWLPSWGFLHWTGWAGWLFPLLWVGFITAAYGVGSLIKK